MKAMKRTQVPVFQLVLRGMQHTARPYRDEDQHLWYAIDGTQGEYTSLAHMLALELMQQAVRIEGPLAEFLRDSMYETAEMQRVQHTRRRMGL